MKRFLPNFARDEKGSTIEFVIWFPMFAIILSLIADTSLIFFGQSRIYRITQVANRAYSIGNLESETDLETYINSAVSAIGGSAEVTSRVTDGIIHTMVRVPARDFEAVGLITTFGDLKLTVTSDMVMENT